MYDRESLLYMNEGDTLGEGRRIGADDEIIRRSNHELAESETDELLCGVLKEFLLFCNTPHGSGNEAALALLLQKHLALRGFASSIDDMGNLICDIPASPGMESAPLTALQGHLDMVCAVREGSLYEPETDLIALKFDFDTATAKKVLCSNGDSSLGADCGICNAAVLWLTTIANSDFRHGALKLIFTTQEEIGLVGATKLDSSIFNDVKYLINVDGFDADHIVTGSAGGRRETFTRSCDSEPLSVEDPSLWCAFEFTLTGFKGGHSGYDIDKGRVNAVKLIADLLADMSENGMKYVLSSFNGGLQHNIIPGSASAVVVFKRDELINCQRSIQMLMYELSMRYGESDWAGRFVYHEIALPKRVLTEQCTGAVVDFVHGLCDGVYAYTDIEKDSTGALVVDTSINIGKISCNAADPNKSNIEVCIFMRSLSDTFGDILLRMNKEASEEGGFVSVYSEYPVWHFDSNSLLAEKTCEIYTEITGRIAIATAVHVGLEPSVFLQSCPNLQMISMGANIYDAHSVNERVEIDSIRDFTLTLRELLFQIGNGVLSVD